MRNADQRLAPEVRRVCVHVTIASPRAFIARSSLRALPPRSERFRASPQLPPAGRSTTCAAVQEPLKRSQAAMAFPAASIASNGWDVLRPGPDRTSGTDQTPRSDRVAACVTRKAPSDQRQAATAAPDSSTATTGAEALPIGPEIVSAGTQAPSIAREDVSMAVRRSPRAIHTAVARPARIATSALNATSPGAERFCGSLQSPPAGRTAAWTTLSCPVDRCQTATAFPSASIASLGDSVAAAGSEMRCAEDQAPPAGRKAAPTADVSPSSWRQTATTLPDPSEAIRGVDPETPASEMSFGWSSPVADMGKATMARTAAKSAVRPSMFHSFRELFTPPACGGPLTRDSHRAHAERVIQIFLTNCAEIPYILGVL